MSSLVSSSEVSFGNTSAAGSFLVSKSSGTVKSIRNDYNGSVDNSMDVESYSFGDYDSVPVQFKSKENESYTIGDILKGEYTSANGNTLYLYTDESDPNAAAVYKLRNDIEQTYNSDHSPMFWQYNSDTQLEAYTFELLHINPNEKNDIINSMRAAYGDQVSGLSDDDLWASYINSLILDYGNDHSAQYIRQSIKSINDGDNYFMTEALNDFNAWLDDNYNSSHNIEFYKHLSDEKYTEYLCKYLNINPDDKAQILADMRNDEKYASLASKSDDELWTMYVTNEFSAKNKVNMYSNIVNLAREDRSYIFRDYCPDVDFMAKDENGNYIISDQEVLDYLYEFCDIDPNRLIPEDDENTDFILAYTEADTNADKEAVFMQYFTYKLQKKIGSIDEEREEEWHDNLSFTERLIDNTYSAGCSLVVLGDALIDGFFDMCDSLGDFFVNIGSFCCKYGGMPITFIYGGMSTGSWNGAVESASDWASSVDETEKELHDNEKLSDIKHDAQYNSGVGFYDTISEHSWVDPNGMVYYGTRIVGNVASTIVLSVAVPKCIGNLANVGNAINTAETAVQTAETLGTVTEAAGTLSNAGEVAGTLSNAGEVAGTLSNAGEVAGTLSNAGEVASNASKLLKPLEYLKNLDNTEKAKFAYEAFSDMAQSFSESYESTNGNIMSANGLAFASLAKSFLSHGVSNKLDNILDAQEDVSKVLKYGSDFAGNLTENGSDFLANGLITGDWDVCEFAQSTLVSEGFGAAEKALDGISLKIKGNSASVYDVSEIPNELLPDYTSDGDVFTGAFNFSDDVNIVDTTVPLSVEDGNLFLNLDAFDDDLDEVYVNSNTVVLPEGTADIVGDSQSGYSILMHDASQEVDYSGIGDAEIDFSGGSSVYDSSWNGKYDVDYSLNSDYVDFEIGHPSDGVSITPEYLEGLSPEERIKISNEMGEVMANNYDKVNLADIGKFDPDTSKNILSSLSQNLDLDGKKKFAADLGSLISDNVRNGDSAVSIIRSMDDLDAYTKNSVLTAICERLPEKESRKLITELAISYGINPSTIDNYFKKISGNIAWDLFKINGGEIDAKRALIVSAGFDPDSAAGQAEAIRAVIRDKLDEESAKGIASQSFDDEVSRIQAQKQILLDKYKDKLPPDILALSDGLSYEELKSSIASNLFDGNGREQNAYIFTTIEEYYRRDKNGDFCRPLDEVFRLKIESNGSRDVSKVDIKQFGVDGEYNDYFPTMDGFISDKCAMEYVKDIVDGDPEIVRQLREATSIDEMGKILKENQGKVYIETYTFQSNGGFQPIEKFNSIGIGTYRDGSPLDDSVRQGGLYSLTRRDFEELTKNYPDLCGIVDGKPVIYDFKGFGKEVLSGCPLNDTDGAVLISSRVTLDASSSKNLAMPSVLNSSAYDANFISGGKLGSRGHEIIIKPTEFTGDIHKTFADFRTSVDADVRSISYTAPGSSIDYTLSFLRVASRDVGLGS